MKYLLAFSFSFFSLFLFAQDVPQTSAVERMAGLEQRKKSVNQSLVQHIPFRNVGPSVFGGRIVDLEVNPLDPSIFYAAYASGGLWKTKNNGTSFSPLFEQEGVLSIGDIAVNWEQNTIWVGTGENNSSRSSYSGLGIYKSTDGGETWEHKGLAESHHIGRIILHPSNPDILWVAVLGHLYSPNEERGVYKSVDGGDTWTHTLFVNPNAGAVDLLIDPDDPQKLFAATWERERRAWNFVEAGEGSGIYRSNDGGDNWTLMTTQESAFPTGEGVGRIGLALTKKDGKNILFASLDNYNRRPPEDKDQKKGLTKDDLRTMDADAFAKLDSKKLNTFLKENRFPNKYDAETVFKMVKKGQIQPLALVEYLEDANSLLFDTPVIGAEVYRSIDDGKSWKKTHDGYLEDLFYSYGYYFGQIRVSPHNPEKIYILGVPVLRSDDGGATFVSINGDNVHVDHHALWLSPLRDEHIILGNDGGVNISYDDGEHWVKCNTPAVGQFYTVAVDHAEPYNIYGGLQDNGVWMGESTYKASNYWHNSGHYPYEAIMGGDGMQVAIDLRDNKTVYTGSQFGFYYRLDLAKEKRTFITPKPDLGENKLRWNWQTPIHLSIHNQDILYMGSNKVHRSMKQGKDFKTISEDLTKGGRKGDVAYGTLTSIHESSLRFGLIYTGSDDGLIHVSKDGGITWEKITEGLPEDLWVSRVQASAHEEGTVYASLNGYRWDDFKAYVYRSTDFGKTWLAIATDLPAEPVNVIKEDPVNENILYIGTDHGVYVSLNQGRTSMRMGADLPAVPVHDLVVHPRDKDLILATHGRSFYVADISALQELDEEVLAERLKVFALETVNYSSRWGNSFSKWRKPSEPKLIIPVFVKDSGTAKIMVKTKKGELLATLEKTLEAGLNYVAYDLSIDNFAAQKLERLVNEGKKDKEEAIEIAEKKNGKYYLYKGDYSIEVSKNGKKEAVDLTIKGR